MGYRILAHLVGLPTALLFLSIHGSAFGASLPMEAQISADLIQKAASDANDIAGTDVKVKTSPSSDPVPVLVTCGTKEKLLAHTVVWDNRTPLDPTDDVALAIVINKDELEALVPGILEDPDLLRLILGYVLSHEFDHVPSTPSGGGCGQGGSGHLGGASCAHLGGYVSNASDVCAEVTATAGDTSLSAAERCKRAAALCKLYKLIQSKANTPENVAAAANCSGVTVSDGKIVGDCAACASGECPVHGTSFGEV